MKEADEMKPFESVHAYLEARGLLEGSPASIVQAKKEYWRAYRKHYMRNYPKKRITITLKPDLYSELQLVCKILDIAACEYIRKTLINSIPHLQQQIDTQLLVEIESILLWCLDSIDEYLESNPSASEIQECQKQLDKLLKKIRSLDH